MQTFKQLKAATIAAKTVVLLFIFGAAGGLTAVVWNYHLGYALDYATISANIVTFGLTMYGFAALLVVPVFAFLVHDVNMARKSFLLWVLLPFFFQHYWAAAGFFLGAALISLMVGWLSMENKSVAIGLVSFFVTFALLRLFSQNMLFTMALDMSTTTVAQNSASLLTIGLWGLGGSQDIVSQQFAIYGIGDDYWTFASSVIMPGMLMWYARTLKSAAGNDPGIQKKARLAFIGASTWSFAGVMSLTLVAAIAGKVPAYMVPALWGLLLYGGGWGRIWAALTVLGVYGGLTMIADMIGWMAPSKFE